MLRALGVGVYTKKTPWYERFPTERGVPGRSDGYQKATEVHTCIMRTRPTVTRTLFKNAFSEAAILSCIANDYGYDAGFSRQVEAQAQCGDLLVLLSTSGNSPNVIESAKTAHALGVTTVHSPTGRRWRRVA